MAKFEITLHEPFDTVLQKVEHGIMDSSLSASFEDGSSYYAGGARCAVRVFERYSWLGGNRVSLTVTLFQADGSDVRLSAITSGGSQAMFFKLNTFGEEAFLDKLKELFEK